MAVVLTPERIIDVIQRIFLENLEYTGNSSGTYFWKWAGNSYISEIGGWDRRQVRTLCHKMHKEGKLEMRKASGCLSWACAIDGYVQHEMKDYYKKA